jgi:glycosyltransferase involved in cell wall biosynthesis
MLRTFTGKIGTLFKYIKFWLGFSKYLFKSYDVVHIHFLMPNIILGWIYKVFHPRTFLVVTLHGEDITVQYPKLKRIFKLFTKKVDLMIPVGKTLNELSLKHFPEIKTDIIPVGVDDRVFRWDSSKEKKYDFAFVGSFIHRKGIDYLTQALKNEKEKQYRFLFIGSGELEDSIIHLNKHHQIEIKNNLTQKEISDLLNSSKWLVLPSRDEGFPTVTIEGFYCGLPVLGSSIPQIKEQVQVGKNGFIYEVENAKELQTKLNDAIEISDDEYFMMSKFSSESWRQISLSEVCNHLIEIYKNHVQKS